MKYLAVAPDGQEYGPVSMETLHKWVAESRLEGSWTIRDTSTGESVKAAEFEDLFPPPPVIPPPVLEPVPAPQAFSSPYVRPAISGYSPYSENLRQRPDPFAKPGADLAFTVTYCLVALILFSVFVVVGIVFSSLSVYRSVGFLRRRTANAKACLAISLLTLAIVIAGTIFRGLS